MQSLSVGVISDTHGLVRPAAVAQLRGSDLIVHCGDVGHPAVLSGHSHRPLVERRNGVLFVNPGSAGPKRFSLPIAVARLVLSPDGCDARIVELAV